MWAQPRREEREEWDRQSDPRAQKRKASLLCGKAAGEGDGTAGASIRCMRESPRQAEDAESTEQEERATPTHPSLSRSSAWKTYTIRSSTSALRGNGTRAKSASSGDNPHGTRQNHHAPTKQQHAQSQHTGSQKHKPHGTSNCDATTAAARKYRETQRDRKEPTFSQLPPSDLKRMLSVRLVILRNGQKPKHMVNRGNGATSQRGKHFAEKLAQESDKHQKATIRKTAPRSERKRQKWQS